jgi:hypothetical protein
MRGQGNNFKQNAGLNAAIRGARIFQFIKRTAR